MNRYLVVIIALAWLIVGCEESNPAKPEVFRGNPIASLPGDGYLRAGGSPYLVVDTIRVPAGKTLTIEPGTEVRFETGIPLEVSGKIVAKGTVAAPIIFTSGSLYPARGDWDGIHLTKADPASIFEHCQFRFGAKYGRRFFEREVAGEKEKAVIDYGALTVHESNPTIRRCSFLANGFHGIHVDSLSNPVIENNLFFDNAGHGLFVHYSAKPEVRYNLIVENDDYGMFCKQPTESARDSLTFEYNLMWSNFSGEYNMQAPRYLGRINNINANLDSCDAKFNLRIDPQFKDAAKWDFNLNPCSGAIDAGPERPDLRDADGTRIELGLLTYNYRSGEIRRRIPNLPRIGNKLEAGKTYIMTCDILLPVGETLTIEPGVTVKVEGQYKFRVRGKILSNGTSASPVKFTATPVNKAGMSVDPKRGDWFGLIFESGGDQGSHLQHTHISYARWGAQLTRRDATFEYCTISQSDSIGIMCDDMSSPIIRNCNFIDNSVSAILCQFNSNPKILRNRISGGAGYGIFARQNSAPDIYNNLIRDVATSGIKLENLASPKIVNNTIVSNVYYGINMEYNCDPVIKNNIFSNNGLNGRGGVGVLGRATSMPELKYNCFFGHSLHAVDLSGEVGLPVTNINENPQFVDPSKVDYRLKTGSPCLSKGDPAIDAQMGAFGGPSPLL